MDWKQYQNETAELFRSLGCDVDGEAKVAGVRAVQEIDVWVRFRKFGLETKWVIECKCWTSAVPKEKVLTLQSIIGDVGADRGILVSAAGCQSGAIRASEKTNIILTDLEGLRETAKEDLNISVLYSIENKTVELKYALNNLYTTSLSTPGRGIDINEVAYIENGFDRVRLKKPPYHVKSDPDGNNQVIANTVDEFSLKL